MSGRIIGGTNANPAQWPSVALLYNKNTLTKCTASILSPKRLVASYSCIEEAISRDLNEYSFPLAGDDWVVYVGHAVVNVMNKSDTNMVPVNRIIPYSSVCFSHINQFYELKCVFFS